jgi:hypothetical protein
MNDEIVKSSKRVLDPMERVSEVLFGLIMVLTFTGSLSVAEAGRDDVRTMLIGAIGCNLAWGIIDAVLYLMSTLADKGRGLMTLRAVRQTTNPAKAQRLIANALPSVVSTVLQPAEYATIQQRLKELPEPQERAHLNATEWRGGVGVFLLVFLSTLPVALPFLFIQSAMLAIRVSNLVAMLMLFFTGVAYGRCVGRSPWLFGLAMIILGGCLVALTMALGG